MIAASLWAQIATAQPARPQAPSVALDEVWAAASAGDRVFVGGDLLGVGAAADMQAGFAVVDRTTGQRVVNASLTGRNRLSTAIADGTGGYYVGGWFSQKPGLVRLRADGTQDPQFVPSFYADPDWREGPPSALALVGNRLFVVRHVQYDPPLVPGQDCGESWLMVLDPATGAETRRSWRTGHYLFRNLCSAGNQGVFRRIYGLAVVGDTVYAAGLFDHLTSPDTGEEIGRWNIVAFDGVTGDPLAWPASVRTRFDMVHAVSSEGETLLLATSTFATLNPGSETSDIRMLNVATRQESVWLSDPSLFGVTSVALIGGTAILGGWFWEIAGQPRLGLAAVDASGALLPWAPRTNARVLSLNAASQTVYVAGEFSKIDGQARLGAAAFDFSSRGTLTAWNPAASGRVRAVTPLTGAALLVGDFSATRAVPRSSIAALDAATGALLPWTPQLPDAQQRPGAQPDAVRAADDSHQPGDHRRGAQAASRKRGFLLGLTYGGAMAFVYGVLGLIVVLTASTFGTINASPWFNLGIAILFVALSLAMFDVFEIDFSKYSANLGAGAGRGTFLLAFTMGAVAALLAGACVAPVVIQVVLFSSNLYATGTTIALALPFFRRSGTSSPRASS